MIIKSITAIFRHQQIKNINLKNLGNYGVVFICAYPRNQPEKIRRLDNKGLEADKEPIYAQINANQK